MNVRPSELRSIALADSNFELPGFLRLKPPRRCQASLMAAESRRCLTGRSPPQEGSDARDSGVSERPPPRGPPTGKACARRPTSCERRCSTSWRRGSTARACSTGLPAPGAVGIEALSRGAAHVTFVESDARAIRLIERNLDHCASRRPLCYYPREVCGRCAQGDPQGRSTSCFSIRPIGQRTSRGLSMRRRRSSHLTDS